METIAPIVPAIHLQLDWLPPSLNAISTKGSHWRYTKAKREAHGVLVPALEAISPGFLFNHVYATGHLVFPRRRRRDQGNFRATLEKFLGDALQEAGWLEDDTWDSFEFGDLSYTYTKGVSRTHLKLKAR